MSPYVPIDRSRLGADGGSMIQAGTQSECQITLKAVVRLRRQQLIIGFPERCYAFLFRLNQSGKLLGKTGIGKFHDILEVKPSELFFEIYGSFKCLCKGRGVLSVPLDYRLKIN
jgi:hypothetical protein